MFRRIAASMMVASMAALGVALTAPGTAAAEADDIYCSATSVPNEGVFDPHNPGHLLGWIHRSYVGSGAASPAGGTWRIWHVTSVAAGSGTTHYSGAFATRCLSDNSSVENLDLTKDVALAGNPPICGVTDFSTNFFASYHYLGSRFNDGDKFRYWATLTLFGSSVTAARCD